MNPSTNEELHFKNFILFFLPLIMMTQLHQISHSVVHAFLARLENPAEVLAAFSIAFCFNITLASTNMVVIQYGISFISDRSSFWKVFRFALMVCIVTVTVIETVALTPIGNLVFGKWMGASPAVVIQARQASGILGIWIFPVMVRNLLYALVMVYRRTSLIAIATVIRVVSLILFLVLFTLLLDGAAAGAAGTVAGMAVETIFMIVVARSLFSRLAHHVKPPPTYYEIWRFSWPLIITQSVENGVALALFFFLGRLANPDLALAGFGVTYGLVRLVLAPLRNLNQAAQALTRSRRELKMIFNYGLCVIIFFVSVVLILFFTPLRYIILTHVMGLTTELTLFVTPGVKLTFVVAIFWALASMFRGMLSAMRRTGAIAATAGLRLLVVVMVGSWTLFLPQANGTVIGVLAIGGAFATESVILGLRLYGHLKSPQNLFSHI